MMEDENALEQPDAGNRPSNDPHDDFVLDMKFDFVDHDYELDSTADTSQFADNHALELDDEAAVDDTPGNFDAMDLEGFPEIRALAVAADTEIEDSNNVHADAELQHSAELASNPGLLTPPTVPLDGDDIETEEVQSDSEVGATVTEDREVTEPIQLEPSESASTDNLEVILPAPTLEQREEYEEIQSNTIGVVVKEDDSAGAIRFLVEFVDGREELISYEDLVASDNGREALLAYYNPDMDVLGKRKRDDGDSDEYGSDGQAFEGQDSPLGALVSEDEDNIPRRRTRRSRAMRSGASSIQPAEASPHQSLASGADESDGDTKTQPRRSARARKSPQSYGYKSQYETHGNIGVVDNDSDEPILITSDLHGPAQARRSKMRRQQARAAARPKPKQQLGDSDIEFEAPRRSQRSTRNQLDMTDDIAMDDDSFMVTDNKAPSAPKIASVREIFQPINPESDFAAVHIKSCHTCGQGRQKGQLIHCQGCSLTYHKHCLGVRSSRDHLVTKIGEDDFVLQCRFCINIYRKKDRSAPRHNMCQDCNQSGKACHAFSQKKTARQEEKLREENDGADPITTVSPDLVNNAELVLFRCVKCHRGWHIKHLPPTGKSSSVVTDIRSERLEDYSIDWQCNDCSSARQKIHRLVAWRPAGAIEKPVDSEHGALYVSDFDEDAKEYLIKWEDRSYFHCSWKPSAWVFGVAAAVMRNAFAKRDAERSLLSYTEKEAIPTEFLMPDVILNLKGGPNFIHSSRKEEELAQADNIRKIYVKYQGLGYDDVVWDSPPKRSDGEDIYNAFIAAYYDYIDGKFFQHEPLYKMRERIKNYKASEFEEVDVQPAGLQRGKLMGYQVEGLNWLLENYHHGKSVVLADEMGLGKTVQVVSLVVSLVQDKPRCWPFLIVVPNATCPNWRREFKQWTPDLRVVTYHGGKLAQELAYKYELFPQGSQHMKAHVVIMSYDSAADPNTKVLFKNVHWTGLVVDEGQRLKNDQNLLYLALRSMNVPFRLLLTGTPLQNNKRELFNLLQFIDNSQNAAKLDLEFETLDKENLPQLHEKIRPYFLRRTKAGVLKFLPPMAQIILPVTMTVIQEKLSKSIMAKNPQLIKSMFANSKMNKKERGSLNNILMQLRKCLCHPFMYSEAIEERHHDPAVLQQNLIEASAKLLLLQVMLPRLKELGHRVLIFSQFLQQLDIVEDFLNGLGYGFRRLDGSMGSLEKQRRIDAFNAPDSELFAFLLSTRAGGVGINLATADTVIIMDPDFNPHQDLQALSRAHRIGQKKNVLCFQLVTKDSVEERIMQIGRKKMALDHALIESMDDEDLAGDDLESILKHGAQALFDDDYQKKAIHYDAAAVDKILDRSKMAQTKAEAESSTDGQYSYAKVWANDKATLEDTLVTGEDEAPEPINSSVWDRILAEREEQARKEAEANREVLGRGGRRRTAVGGYQTNTSSGAAIPGGASGNASDSSDVYSGAESAEESDDDAPGKDSQDQLVSEANSLKGDPRAKPSRSETLNPDAQGKVPRRRSKISNQGVTTNTKEGTRHLIGHANGNSPSLSIRVPNDAKQTISQIAARRGYPPGAQHCQLNSQPAGPLKSAIWDEFSEVQLRLAMDHVRRGAADPQNKRAVEVALLQRLAAMRMQNGKGTGRS